MGLLDRIFGGGTLPLTSKERQAVLEEQAQEAEKLAEGAETLLAERKAELELEGRVGAAQRRRLKALGEVKELSGKSTLLNRKTLLWLGAFGLLVIFIMLMSNC